MPLRRAVLRLCFLCAVGLLAGGCVQTAMLPARQVEPGTTVAAASLDEPGALFLPRLNVQVTQGVGGGDLTANVSGIPGGDEAVALAGAGLTGRLYVSRTLSAELQWQSTSLLGYGQHLALLGVQEIPAGEDSWYVGGQAGAINGRGRIISDVGPTPRRTAPVIGGSVGYGPVRLGPDWRMQVELAANAPLGVEEGPFPATRLSLGIFRLFR